jgi:F0F1-type ATP synthase membrane subunit b/b'
VGIVALIKIMALEKSTHSIQYVPVDEEIDKANEEYMKQWATDDAAIAKERKLYQEELADEMPEFALNDNDKEVFSI